MALRTVSLRSRLAPWLWAGGTLLLVAGAALATWRALRTPALATPTTAEAGPAPRLAAGHDYYLHVKLIELADRMPGDKQWDRVDDSGPDICFNLTWRGNVIWKSSEKSNTLIGSWDLLKVDVRQLITGGNTDLEGLVNAPLVHYASGETVELKVWDSDPVGSDDAGTIKLNLSDLQPGENTLLPSGGGAKSVKRLVIGLIDRRTPLPELVNTISNR
jgi:hypothetical protein